VSVRGEFRRLGADLEKVLREAGGGDRVASADALAPLLERAVEDLNGAAEAALPLLPAIAAASPEDGDARRRFDDAFERFEAVCRIVLGR
jgi:hypothetical protein